MYSCLLDFVQTCQPFDIKCCLLYVDDNNELISLSACVWDTKLFFLIDCVFIVLTDPDWTATCTYMHMYTVHVHVIYMYVHD